MEQKPVLILLRANASSLIESFGRQYINILKGALIVKSFSPVIETISFLSLNKTLICIDDLERKGNGLSVKDVLGLVSLLKEQKKCKVVLLLNDNDGKAGLDYSTYREKAIDIELLFSPNPEECSSIAYSEEKIHSNRLKEFTTSLGIRNIRILKKIERLVDLSLPLVSEFKSEITDQIIHSLVLFSWCYFCSNANEDIPPLEFVTNKGYEKNKDEKKKIENEKKWKTILQSYNYQPTDELDMVLCEAVKTGYFVEADLKGKAKEKNEQIIASKSKGSFFDAWQLYHNSFYDNRDEVIQGIYQSFKDNCKYITPTDLNATVSLFRELGENKKTSELINLYIEKRKSETELFNMQENNLFGYIKDQEIINRFNDIYKNSVKTETAKEVLDRIAGKNAWNQSDEVVLANTLVDEYYKLFKSETGQHLSSFVTTCLMFGQSSDASDQQKEITKRVTEALKKIASESKINRRRVKRFGVDIRDA